MLDKLDKSPWIMYIYSLHNLLVCWVTVIKKKKTGGLQKDKT